MTPEEIAFENNIRDDMRLEYSELIIEIRYQKEQEWKIIYLVLLALGGIISFVLATKESLPDSPYLKYLLLSSTFLATLIGIYYIIHYHRKMIQFRKKQKAISRNYIKQSIKNEKPLKPGDKQYLDYFKEPECCEYFTCEIVQFLLPFSLLILLAGLLAFSLIYDPPTAPPNNIKCEPPPKVAPRHNREVRVAPPTLGVMPSSPKSHCEKN